MPDTAKTEIQIRDEQLAKINLNVVIFPYNAIPVYVSLFLAIDLRKRTPSITWTQYTWSDFLKC